MDTAASPRESAASVKLDTRVAITQSGWAQRLATGSLLAMMSSFVGFALAIAVPVPWNTFTTALVTWMACISLAPVLGLASTFLGRRRWREGAIEAGPSAITVSRGTKRRSVPVARVASAWLATSPSGISVEFKLRGGTVVAAQIPDADAGHRLLDAAKLDVAQRTCALRLGRSPAAVGALSFVATLVPVTMAVMFAMLRGRDVLVGGAKAWLIVMGVLAALTQLVFRAPALELGADGFSLRRRFAKRFVRYADVRDVRIVVPDIKVELRDGAVVTIPTGGVSGFDRDAVLGRICDALAIWRRDGAHAGLELLDRNGRSIAAWRAGLAGVTSGVESYRNFSLSGADLVRALEDPATPAERRLGAAMALLDSGDRDAAQRIRVAASATANEPVRVALDRVAQKDAAGDASLEDVIARATAAARS